MRAVDKREGEASLGHHLRPARLLPMGYPMLSRKLQQLLPWLRGPLY